MRKTSRGGSPPVTDTERGAEIPPEIDRSEAEVGLAAEAPGPAFGDEIAPTSESDDAQCADSAEAAGAVSEPESLHDSEAGPWAGSETTVVALQSLDRPEPGRSDDDRQREISVIEPTLVGNGQASDHGPEPGRWLPLRDAVRAVGSLELLYRLARDGVLRSREGAEGEIEVWVADRDSYRAPPTSFDVEVDGQENAAGVPETSASEVGDAEAGLIEALAEAHERRISLAQENGRLRERLAALEQELGELRVQAARSLAPLTESHERQLQLMRENGALDARVVALERALENAQAEAAGSQASLADAHERQLALVRENGALTERVAALQREKEHDDERARQAASVVAADQPGAKAFLGAAHVPMIMLALAVIIMLALGAGWLVAQIS